MGAKANTRSDPEAVVQRYMAAVKEKRRSDAEKLLARLHVGYPLISDRNISDRRPMTSFGFDWFGYFLGHGYVVSETTVLERTELRANVEAKCIALEGPHPGSRHIVVFRLFLERGSWLISDISLSLDADMRRDEAQ
jgi:hypothetical protein